MNKQNNDFLGTAPVGKLLFPASDRIPRVDAILLIFHRNLLMMFGASENTIDYASSYIQIYALGTIFVQLTLGMNAYITAQGFSKISMLTILIGAVCNIILDPIFIFIFDIGVSGAALATIISQGISCVWVVLFLCGKKTFLRLKKETLKIRFDLVLPCIALGIAPFIMQSSENIISVCFNSSLLKYDGDVAVGAMTILTSWPCFPCRASLRAHSRSPATITARAIQSA